MLYTFFRIFILVMVFLSNSFSQDLLSFTPLSEPNLPSEIQKLNDDIKTLHELSESTNDLKLINEINKAKFELEKALILKRITETKMKTSEGEDLLDRIKKKASAPSLKISSDIQLRPSGDNQNDFLSPIVSANYKSYLIKKKENNFIGQYDFLLSIQTPSAIEDTTKLVTRILSTGPDGVFQFGTKFGWQGIENAFLTGINIKLNWLNSRSLSNENLASFAYLSLSHLEVIKIGPVIFGYEQEFRFVDSDDKDILSKSIDKSMSGNLVVGINIDTIQLQLKYLLNSNKPKSSNERLEIRFGAALAILND